MIRIRFVPGGDWDILAEWFKRMKRSEIELKRLRALIASAEHFKAMWKQNLASPKSAPANQPLTMLTKHGNIRGMDTGATLKQIKTHATNMYYFVGIRNDQKINEKDGVTVASANEFGVSGRRFPKKAKWLSIPLTRKAKAVGTPLKYPGSLKWSVEEDGFNYWVDSRTNEAQYLNVSSISGFPGHGALQKTVREWQVLYPNMVMKHFGRTFLFHRGRKGTPK